jgi:hypothetical protein
MLNTICGCVKTLNNKYSSEKKVTVTDKGDALQDLLRKNLMTIRGRRQLLRDVPIAISPTKFEDDEDVQSEDEDGDEESVLKNGVFAGQDFYRLRSKCLESGKQFVDPQFPPCSTSLTLKANDGSIEGIEWKRPAEICDSPKFLVEGYSRFDVKQGELGDCWLLAAIANLTLHKKLLAKVVPHDQGFVDKYAGIFHFR